MDVPLAKVDVTTQLWAAYKKSNEYLRLGQDQAIPAHHPLVIQQERAGLRAIYVSFVESLLRTNDARTKLSTLPVSGWLGQWREMHHLLFRRILKQHGDWRKQDVRFGAPGDEELHGIPAAAEVVREISFLAHNLTQRIATCETEPQERYKLLAWFHYQFIRIHPFPDGNGRIARAVTDQIAIHFGFPPAMAGYPRHDAERRAVYHEAITAGATDVSCERMAQWIANYIEKSIEQAA